ncbi:MAG: riboflavin synthase [Rickettsiales bacterium]|nr:riboflavin synthase [Pseudomonadota bacterium]MDA0966251.1 riboflavin synthase [Pseudomonadota bacterium]MDG4543084.1 riboflavin synthase [Rickettsiales bacterium]MDG4545282.1 riboflavin synthase [Rickettsiales bacterium]MDG4547731.1 riboflavin synthase [Rickettsiales bacterium]
MFTGIITDIGSIVSLDKKGELLARIKTSYNIDSIDIGASIAHNGVCLTVISKKNDTYCVEISDETVSCTDIADWKEGDKVNLERALKVGDELGGHIVSGHVDGLAEIISIKKVNDSHEIVLKAPRELKYFIASKGSVTLNGVSLTVNKVDDNKFYINIIPHTWEFTNFNSFKAGQKINLEIDTLARYVARLNEQKNI